VGHVDGSRLELASQFRDDRVVVRVNLERFPLSFDPLDEGSERVHGGGSVTPMASVTAVGISVSVTAFVPGSNAMNP